MLSSPALVVENMTTDLRGRRILNAISLSVQPGETLGIFGHNGAGKSTLLRSILGLVRVESGSIHLGFARWSPNPRQLLKAGVCYLPQGEKIFIHMTVEENLKVVAEAAHVERPQFLRRYDELAELFTILDVARTVPAGRLSGGEVQQVALARSLLLRPRLMLLDEPSIGLTPALRTRAFEAIAWLARSFSTAVLLVEHRVIEALKISNRACVLRRGALAISDTARGLLADPERLRSAIV